MTSSTKTIDLADRNNPFSLRSVSNQFSLNGVVFKQKFDNINKVITSESALGRKQYVYLDSLDRPVEIAVPGRNSIYSFYDHLGRTTNIVQGAGADQREMSVRFNAVGYPETVTDSLGRSVAFEYDSVGRLLSQTTDDNRITQFRYDENGNVTQIAPPGRPGHLMEYDAIDLLSVYDPPVAFTGPRETFYQYDLDQAVTNIVRPDGLQISYQMDSARRLERIVSPEGTITLHYDNPDCGCSGDSKPTRIDGCNGQSLQFKYDGGVLTNVILTGEVSASISVQFDNNLRARKQWLNYSSPIDFNYDNDGLMIQAQTS